MRHRKTRWTLFCTGLLLLVLSVLPHHHHCDGTMRFVLAEQCAECNEENDGHATQAKHHHPESDEACDLRQLFVMSGRNDDHHETCLCPAYGHPAGGVFVLTLFYTVAPEAYPGAPHLLFSLLDYPPFATPLNGLETCGATALRAPPVFIA